MIPATPHKLQVSEVYRSIKLDTIERGGMMTNNGLRKEGWYAIAMWCTEDIHEARERKGLPKLSETEAEAWLSIREDKIKDSMIEQGWEVISAFLAEEVQ